MVRVELVQANVSDEDDVQDIEQDILSLAREFIFPIDAIRSNTRPAPLLSQNTENDPFDDLKIDPTRPLESRTHAFYRLVGFPVVDPTNERFYNPGFGRKGFSYKRSAIDSWFNVSVSKELSDLREEFHIDQREVFEQEDAVAAFYALTLRHIRPFQPMDDAGGPTDKDAQAYNVADRVEELNKLVTKNPGLEETLGLAIGARPSLVGAGSHILRPFMVDPRIDQTCDPAKKPAALKAKLIGVPFLLTEEDKQVEPGILARTPLIEEIICARLADTVEDGFFRDDVRKILENENTPSAELRTLDNTTLTNTVNALLEDNKINPDSILQLKGITKTEVLQLVRFVKIIKVLVTAVHGSMRIIDKAQKEINWIPVPSTDGPELGVFGATLFREKGTSQTSTIDRNIAHLQVQELKANKALACGVLRTASGAASNLSMVSNSAGQALGTIKSQKLRAVNKRNRIATSAFKAMGDIERIMGETTGFGLIDAVSIHATLWAIPLEVLLGFLDEEAVTRLQSVPGLNTDAVENRERNIINVLTTFEQKLINILDFAQKEFERQKGTPIEEEGGTV